MNGSGPGNELYIKPNNKKLNNMHKIDYETMHGFRDFFQGKVEQAAVVSFELDGSVFFQNLVVAGKKFPGGKTA